MTGKKLAVGLIKKAILIFAYFIISFAVLVSLTRALSPFLMPYQPTINQWLSEKLNISIDVNLMKLGWQGFYPTLLLEDVNIAPPLTANQKTILKQDGLNIQTVKLSLNGIKSLIEKKIILHSIIIEGVSLKFVKNQQNNYTLEGYETTPSSVNYTPILNWIFMQPLVSINNLAMAIEQNLKSTVSIKNLAIKITNEKTSHRLKSTVTFDDSVESTLNIIAKAKGDLSHPANLNIKIFIEGNKVLLDSLPQFFTKKNINIKGGLANFSIKGDISGINSTDFQSQGQASFDSQAIEIDMPNLFRQPLQFSSMQTKMDWFIDNEIAAIKMPDFTVTTPISMTHAQTVITWPHKSKDLSIDLIGKSKFQQFGKQEVLNYLPVGIIPKPVTAWLDKAIQQSGPLEAMVILKGPISHFPFDDFSGTFLIDASVNNVNLDYYTPWPLLKNLSGQIRFLGRTMEASINQGSLNDNQITKLDAVIPTMSARFSTLLQVKGQVQGDLKNGLLFIQQSPLNITMGKRLQNLTAEGPMQLDLNLQIPLNQLDKNHLKPLKVDGTVKIEEATVNLKAFKLSANRVAGELKFNEVGISSQGIQGNLFNFPAQITISSQLDKNNQTIVTVKGNGKIDISFLEQNYDLLLTPYLSGQTAFDFQIDLAQQFQDKLSISSNLIGVSSTLPGFLNKKTSQGLPLQVNFNFGKQGPLQVSFELEKKLKGLLQFKQDKELTFDKGTLHFGGDSIALPLQPGLWINGTLESIDLDQIKLLPFSNQEKRWRDWIEALKPYRGGVNIEVQQLLGQNQLISNLQLQASLASDHLNIKANSDKIKGSIHVPFNLNDPVIIAADYLRLNDITLSRQEEIKSSSMTFESWPRLQFNCQNLNYGTKALGEVDLHITPTNNKLIIDYIKIANQSFLIQAAGQWVNDKTLQSTSLKGSWTSSDLEKTSQALAIPINVYSNEAAMDFDIAWPGSPFQPSVQALSGNVFLQVKEGRIEGLSKETSMMLSLGRVITLLSLESIPKRLQLNFRDLTHSGYNFDSMQGHFIFQQGSMLTEDAVLRGTVAKVNMKGSIGLAAKDYHLQLIVVPHITSSLPLVATLAGGPIAGVVTWAVNQLLSQEVKNFTQSIYIIEGPWNKPHIIPLKKSLPAI